MRILFVQLGRIGDAILSTPVFKAIKNKYPDCSIDVIAGKAGYGVLKNNPFINRIFVLDKSPLPLLKFILSLRCQRYDYHIDAKDHYSTESKLLAKLSRADQKIGFKPARTSYFTIGIPSYLQNENTHYADRCFKPLQYLGITAPAETQKPDLFYSDDSEKYASDFLKEINGDFILINISASMPRKMWPMEKWAEFLNIHQNDFRFCISSAPAERETANKLKQKCPFVSIYRSRNIEDVFALVHRCKLVITPDTSVVHIAAAYDKPLIGLYAGIENFYQRFRPLSTNQIVIRAKENFDGISPIDVSVVSEALIKMTGEIYF